MTCKDCGKQLNKHSKSIRCKSCFQLYSKSKDFSAKCSESQSLNDFSYDAVSEMSDSKYGRRLSEGFRLLNED